MLIVTILIGTLFFYVSTVNAVTYVDGEITSNTTWTKAGGPYRVSGGDLSIPSGVTLTIDPGTVVDLSSYRIYVYGTLNCRGANNDKVIFYSSSQSSAPIYFSYSTNWSQSTGTGSIIDNAVLSSVSVTVRSCSPKLSNDYFTNINSQVINVNSGSPLITNNAFDCQNTAIYVNSGSPTISYNFIKSTGATGIYAGTSSSVLNNNITGCYTGVSASGNSAITGNLITSNTYGASVGTSVTVENNIFTNNSYGVSGGGHIRRNTIVNNAYGISISSVPGDIIQNNILSNTVNLRLAIPIAIDVRDNWWGSADFSAINQTMQVTQSQGQVNFTPVLTQPAPDAPEPYSSIQLVPSPTPTPFVPPISPTPTPYPSVSLYPTHTPEPNAATIPPCVYATPVPFTTPVLTPTLGPTPYFGPNSSPTISPGSPLTLGSSTFAEVLAQFDIMNFAKLVLIGLAIMWVIIILVSIDRKYGRREKSKPKP